MQQLNIIWSMSTFYEHDIYNVLNLDGADSFQIQHHYGGDQDQEDIQEFLTEKLQSRQKIQELPSTVQSQGEEESSEEAEEDKILDKQQQITEQSPISTQNTIEDQEIQFSEAKLLERTNAYNGYNYETQNIGKNLKAATSNALEMWTKAKCFSHLEQCKVLQFKESNGGIQDFQRLFEQKGIKQKCIRYYQSKLILQNILKSNKMDIKNKIAMIRHIQIFRNMNYLQQKTWKLPIR